jgi:hypothetical protein
MRRQAALARTLATMLAWSMGPIPKPKEKKDGLVTLEDLKRLLERQGRLKGMGCRALCFKESAEVPLLSDCEEKEIAHHPRQPPKRHQSKPIP